MMVPKSYLIKSHPPGLREAPIEKQNPSKPSRGPKKPPVPKYPATRPRTPSPAVPNAPSRSTSSPVQIPQSNRKTRVSSPSFKPPSGSRPRSGTRDVAHGNGTQPPTSTASLQSLLSSTTIPRRKEPPGRKSQKLPDVDHVVEFSRLLLEDVAGMDSRTAVAGLGNPQFEELFGHSLENPGSWRSTPDSVQAVTPLSVRSMSTESMPSLVVDDDFGDRSLNDSSSPSPSTQRSPPDRPARLLSTSEDCGDDHPLQHLNVLDPLCTTHEEILLLPTPPKSTPSQKRRKSSLRSNLTASLRALKAAAQTVSSIATTPPTTMPDDFLTRSFFSFAPELTDDKRPPPSDNPPSPALRRYLNPHSSRLESRSPAELHSYHEYPSRYRDAKKDDARPPSPPPTLKSIQLQTCIPSPVRSPNASSPPIWLSPNGTPATPPEPASLPAPNPPRQREPRENGAFLRILVAEMNMRRSGKFDETMDSHACFWLPPRKAVDGHTLRSARDRWTVYVTG